MPSVTYSFLVGATAWVVNVNTGVHQCVVSRLNIQQVFPAIAPTIQYTVMYVPPVPASGTSGIVNEADMFATLQLALDNLECRLTNNC